MRSTPITHCPQPPCYSVLFMQAPALSAGARTVCTSKTSCQSHFELSPHLLILKLSPRTAKSTPVASASPPQRLGMASPVFPEIPRPPRGAAITPAAAASHRHLTFPPLCYRRCPSAASSHAALNERGRARKSDGDPELAASGRDAVPIPAPSLGCEVGFT